MNLFVVSPGWHWLIILYFFLGGIAAGAYFTAIFLDLVGDERERELARVGYWIAFPLVMLCGLLLTVDLDQPERFWHMLLKSEIVREALAEGWPGSARSWAMLSHALMWKYWSPMSVGAWALLLFGVCSFLSFLGSLWPTGRLSRFLRHGLLGKVLQVLGAAVGLFIAAYTGALLTATNQPFWSDTVWLAPLFLASAATTGIAAMILLARARPTVSAESLARLQHADLWVLLLELVVFGIFLASLGGLLAPVLHSWHGTMLVIGTLVLGILLPLLLHARLIVQGSQRTVMPAILSLLGGFVLRYTVLATPPELLAKGPELRARYAVEGSQGVGTPGPVLLPGFSPEDGRPPNGSPGADPGNHTARLEPRSKVFREPQ